MKILYLSDQDLDNNSGVSQKISMQSQAWLDLGHEVIILSLQSLSYFSVSKQRLTPPIIKMHRSGWKIFIHLIYSSWKLKQTIKVFDFDIVYMRYRLYSPFLKSALKGRPQIVEINTDDLQEYKHSSVFLQMYNKIFRNFFLKNSDGFICVSRELEVLFKDFSKPISVIANGINVKDFRIRQRDEGKRPTLVFIGSPNQQWHGIEKILYMAEHLPEFDFHIIGDTGKDTKNLFHYGYLPTNEANKIVEGFDIGISTLSLYEKQMNEASPLKARQYLAQGLALIYAYEDTDFMAEQNFLLKLDNSPDNVNQSIEKIRTFVHKVSKDKSLALKIQNFANETIDVRLKEMQRLAFFREQV